MDLRLIKDSKKQEYNKLVTHVIQSWEWGEFRKSLGIPLLRFGIYQNNKLPLEDCNHNHPLIESGSPANDCKLTQAFQITLHKIPFTNQFVGYLPKGPYPDKELVKALRKIGEENNCAFIKIEPDIEISNIKYQMANGFIKSPKPLFTKYNFVLDLTKLEAELLKNMHPKTRYNIRIAKKHGVKVEEKTDQEAFEIYLKLYFETTKRQGYHGHNTNYHKKVWETLTKANMARLLIAYYDSKPLTAWMLLNFKDTLYYPYGGSSKDHQKVMANNLVAWEAIRLGQRLKLKHFDMWGALGPDPNPKDSWYGFHHFKQGYGGKLVEYLGTYDLVFNWPVYLAFTAIDRLTPLKVFLLKLIGK